MVISAPDGGGGRGDENARDPGGNLELEPGSYHLMLFDLRQPLKKGDKFPLTLTFARAGTLEVSVVVEDMAMPIGATRKP